MKPTFKAQPVQVQVPASSANLGPGFDCLGLALNMHDRYMAQVMDEPGVDIDVTGEGADNVPTTDKNLVIKAMHKGFDFLGGRPRGIALRQLNVIPHGRGLGSSAAAIVGGLALARALVLGGNERMSNDDMLNIANEMEGHPDNVSAAILRSIRESAHLHLFHQLNCQHQKLVKCCLNQSHILTQSKTQATLQC